MSQPIVFDVGGVLILHDTNLFLQNLIARMQTPTTPEELLAFIRQSGIGKGQKTMQAFHQSLQQRFGFTGDEPAFLQTWSSHFQPNQPMLDLLPQLRQKHPLYVCSNTNPAHWQYVEENFQLSRYFDGLILSYQAGAEKPDADIFTQAHRRLPAGSAQPLFIDDTEANVTAASQNGFTAHPFTTTQNFLRFLHATT